MTCTLKLVILINAWTTAVLREHAMKRNDSNSKNKTVRNYKWGMFEIFSILEQKWVFNTVN